MKLHEIGKTNVKYLDGSFLWEYKCYCGNTFRTLKRSVDSGKTKSCGCLVAETMRKWATGKAPKNKLPPIARSVAHSFMVYKASARHKDNVFTLSREDVENIVFMNCHYCGDPPKNTPKRTKDSSKLEVPVNGIDRYDNTKGYTKENCVPCCSRCNYIKSDLSGDAFIGIAEKIAKNSEGRWVGKIV